MKAYRRPFTKSEDCTRIGMAMARNINDGITTGQTMGKDAATLNGLRREAEARGERWFTEEHPISGDALRRQFIAYGYAS